MPRITTVDGFIEATSERFIRTQRQELSAAAVDFAARESAALRELCRSALAGQRIETQLDSRWYRLTQRMPFAGLRVPRADNAALVALGAEAFARAPADLAMARLYPEQTQAALALTQRCLVQMDTGEGKTYALLPAAFALCCTYHRVYVVCSSDYLAARDARRTLPFWRFVGVNPGLALRDEPTSEQWSRRVIYTTLEALIFKYLGDEVAAAPAPHPITKTALILDEADATLLDKASHNYVWGMRVDARAFDWSHALEDASFLQEGADVLVDPAHLSASLTMSASARLRERLLARTSDARTVLMYRTAVESAFIALKVVKEDDDYVVEHDRIYPIDRFSGRVERGQTHPWMVPLEFSRGMPPRPRFVEVYEASAQSLIFGFTHLSGTSGTITGDLLEYVLTYQLLGIRIPPRHRRVGDTREDRVFRTRQEALRDVKVLTLEALAMSRPVIIGTQTIRDAETVHALLEGEVPAGTNLRILTGKDDADTAQTFENGGQVGSVIVATQLAGRGVDIRLAPEARSAGGMTLICVDHSITKRHDRQFVGRVGRHGDPFTAIFVTSLESDLMGRLAGARVQQIWESMNMPVDEVIEHSWVTRSISGAQDKIAQAEFFRRQQAAALATTQFRVGEAIHGWFADLQTPAVPQPEQHDTDRLSEVFVERLVDHYVDRFVAPLIEGKRGIHREAAELAEQALQRSLELAKESMPFGALDLEGYLRHDGLRNVKRKLTVALQAAEHQNRERLLQLERRNSLAVALRPVARRARWLAHVLGRLDYIVGADAVAVADTGTGGAAGWLPALSPGESAYFDEAVNVAEEVLRVCESPPLQQLGPEQHAVVSQMLGELRDALHSLGLRGNGESPADVRLDQAERLRLGACCDRLWSFVGDHGTSPAGLRRSARAIAHTSMQGMLIEYHQEEARAATPPAVCGRVTCR